ncbi:MAG: hypothetical protein IRY93_01205, partial [Chthoniobacterales bacterium]|nr:hypothetical protein [Chthoniobacterales bacterium]
MHAVEERQHYYRHPAVRARMREFVGVDASNGDGCEFLTASDDRAFLPLKALKAHPAAALDSLLDGGFEICRSLWDREALIADFDIEYVNFDNPAEAFVDPERAFAIQHPVEQTIQR